MIGALQNRADDGSDLSAGETMVSDRPNFLIIMTDEHNRLVSDIHGKMMRALVDWDTKEGWNTKGHRERLAEAGPGEYLYSQYDDCVATRAAEYLAEPERDDKPWALCVGLITPHFPLIVR